MIYEIPPQSSNCLKSLAAQIQIDGVGHMQTLELTAKKYGYPGWKKAQQELPVTPFKITLEASYETEEGKKGKVALTLPFKKSVQELFYESTTHHALNWFDYIKKRDVFKLVITTNSLKDARDYVARAFRSLYFMQETGLVFSRINSSKNVTAHQIPESCFHRKEEAPYFDHVSLWRNPSSAHLVVLNEPYTTLSVRTDGVFRNTPMGDEVDEWMARHGFVGGSIPHRGLYIVSPTSTFLMTHKSSGYDYKKLIEAFNRVPECLLASQWQYLEDNYMQKPLL